jgi:hypothetical protein
LFGMKFPHYSYPLRLIPGLLLGILSGRHRSFRADAMLCIQGLIPPLRVFGESNIPGSGPCALAMNHYHRPGFGAWWIALAIAAVVPQELHWVMTAEWTFPGRWYGFLGRPALRWVLKRATRMYGFTSMPPMPPRPADVVARSRSVRTVLDHIHHHPGSMLAVSPEGADAPGGVLVWPPTGAGRFLLLLAKEGLPIVPVGCWEEKGSLCLRFGEAYRLVDPGGEAGERDHTAACSVMRAIARQLPLHLRGEFS